MALYNRKEFLEKFQISSAFLSVYKKRGKIIFTDKMIDDSIRENAFWIQERRDKLALEGGEAPSTPAPGKVEKPPTMLTVAQVKDVEEKAAKPLSPQAENAYNLKIEKSKLDIKKTQEDIEIARLKRDKMAGEVIPTDLVMSIFASHFKSVTTSFQQAVENLLSSIAKQNNLDRKQVAEIRGELIEVINTAVRDSIIETKKEVRNIVEEYSQKRGRGERA